MGASASTRNAGTTRDGAVPAGSLRFTPNPAVAVWLAGGAPPPRSDASELLRPGAEALIQQLVVSGRDNENLATPSPQRALQAYENKYGEDAVTKAFGDKTTYLRSCKLPVTVRGTSRRRWWLGDGTPRGDRYFDARSEDAKEILAVTQQSGAAALAAPGGATGAGGDATRPWDGLELVPSLTVRRDLDLNYWEEVVRSNKRPYQDLWDGGNWSGGAPPPKWGVLLRSPSGKKPPDSTEGFYRGHLARGVKDNYHMTKGACGSDATMLKHWARAAFFAERLAEILTEEREAFEAMRDKSEARGNGGGRPRRGPRRSHNPKDAYAALARAETDKLMVEDPRKWSDRHLKALKSRLAREETLLEAIAKDVGVPRCVLTALDKDEQAYLLSPVIKVDLPGLGSQLVLSNWDHEALRWIDDYRAIYLLGFRGLIMDALNKKLPGYEHLLAHAAEREHLDAYLESTLCFDSSFGDLFVGEFKVDEASWWRMTTRRQQQMESRYIKNNLLKGAILGATEGSDEATGRDAKLLRILRERWGADLVFEHAPTSETCDIKGRFRAPDFMGRGETYFSIDHVALGCVRRADGLYRIVAVRGLLPQDMNFHASGYEFVKVLGLESWVEDYLKNAYCEVGVGDLGKSKAVFGYRPNVFEQGAMRKGG